MAERKLVEKKSSKIDHIGLIAKKDISEETKIIEYKGKKLTHKQADDYVAEHGQSRVYYFVLNKRYVLDGDTKDNLAKYINHSCEPNCISDVINGKIWIFALRDIKKGEELTFDYGLHRQDWQDRPCLCQSKSCFGFVVAREHWSGIRRTKRYQTWLASKKK